jgi:hypothetical protein
MQFIAKDLLTLELGYAPGDSSANSAGGAFSAADLVAADLAAESLRASGHLRLRVRGESMLPTLWPGDEVEIASCSAGDVRTGEIVLALRGGRFFLHRFVGRAGGDGFLLRGDSMPGADPEFSRAELAGRLGGSPRLLSPWLGIIGRLLCYCGPARRLALTLHARRRQSQKPMDAIALAKDGPDSAAARGQECPRYTNLSELPRAGA